MNYSYALLLHHTSANKFTLDPSTSGATGGMTVIIFTQQLEATKFWRHELVLFEMLSRWRASALVSACMRLFLYHFIVSLLLLLYTRFAFMVYNFCN